MIPEGTEILTPSFAALARMQSSLVQGECVGVPTETVYGLAANATDARAVARIFEIKGRPTFDPLIVHVKAEWKTMESLAHEGVVRVDSLPPSHQETCQRLMERFWPGPLTLVLPRGPKIADLVTGGLETVGVRMPAHADFQALLRLLEFPLAAPSANRFGRISPTQANHVKDELSPKIPWILDGGACLVGVESTVLDASVPGQFTVLRPGGLSIEALHSVLGDQLQSAREESRKKSPGHLLSHYAPRKKLTLIPSRFHALSAAETLALSRHWQSLENRGERIGILAIQALPDPLASPKRELKILAPDSPSAGALDPVQLSLAAQNLFSYLRALDQSTATLLFAESLAQPNGLAPAIQDRLTRASSSTWGGDST